VVNNYDNVVAELRQLSGETCAITASETEAALSWYESGMPKCLVRWNDLPNGMVVSDVSATGKIVSPGLFPVLANASIVNPNNTTEFSVNYNKNIQSVLLEAPVFEFDGKPILQGSNLYEVGDGGIIGKVTLTDDIFGSVSMSVNAGSSAPVVTKGLKKGAINNVTVAPGTLWSTNSVVVKMVWDNMPELISSMTIRSVVLPPAGMQASITLPKTVVNNQPVTIGVSIGMPSNLGLRFDASKMGSWVGYIGALQADGTVAAITDPIPITKGKENVVYPKASDISNAEIVFVAEVKSQLEGYTSKLISKPAKVVMVDGSGIVPTIRADIKSGAVPLRVKISSDIPSDQSKSLGGIEWLISNDDGATWAVIEKATSASFNHIFKERGRYKIKSKTTNRYSGEVSYSGTVIVDAYALPHLEVEGRSIIRLGSTTNIIAKSTAQHIKWIIEKADGTKDTISNAHLNISSNIAQIVKATALASNEDGEALNDPAAWKEVKVDVRFISLAPVKVALSGSKVLEVGEEGELIATIRTDWDNAHAGFVIHGQWRLPNGTLVDGTTLRWTPTNDDFLSSKMPVFTAWVADFAQQTATSITPRIILKKYVWPDWSLQFKSEAMQAPAAIRLTVVAPPDQLKLFSAIKEKVTYTWGLPSNVSAAVIRGGVASFVADNAGDYPVQVKIEDTRGNVKVLDYTVSVAAPVPIEVNFKTTASNSFNRVPLSLNVKPQFFRLHPREKIVSYRFYRDETLIDDNTKGSVVINFSEPGSYMLKVEAETNLNRTVISERSITVIANKPPTCKLTTRIYKASASITAECKDPDGKIKAFAWKVNGEAIKSSSHRITVPLGATFEVTVTDDANESIALSGTI